MRGVKDFWFLFNVLSVNDVSVNERAIIRLASEGCQEKRPACRWAARFASRSGVRVAHCALN
jgi:hypothetical protein